MVPSTHIRQLWTAYDSSSWRRKCLTAVGTCTHLHTPTYRQTQTRDWRDGLAITQPKLDMHKHKRPLKTQRQHNTGDRVERQSSSSYPWGICLKLPIRCLKLHSAEFYYLFCIFIVKLQLATIFFKKSCVECFACVHISFWCPWRWELTSDTH